ncbi:SRPBCC family protein [Staphylococcus xylosus]|uniref:SRPBCC family protein n=1 Tax=Staphylococcus xylosus TaxID=1288 RepID=UPI00085BE4B4|nr:SRPBCC family protein [Staphylococcus xylosus]
MEWEIVNLDIEFKVNASVKKVFEAWTEPKIFEQWLYTSKETNKVAQNQFEINGDWEIVDERRGKTYRATGTYMDIVEPYKLMYSFKMPQFSDLEDIITVEFIDLENETQVKFNQGIKVSLNDTINKESCEQVKEAAKKQTEEGYNEMFEQLKRILD